MSEQQHSTGHALVGQYRRLRRTGVLLVIIAMALLVINSLLPSAPSLVMPDITPQQLAKLGVHLMLDDGRKQWPVERWAGHMGYAGLVVPNGYAVQLVRSDDLQPEKWQRFFDLAAQYNITPIIRLATVYNRDGGYWEAPPADEDGGYETIAADYAAFLTTLAWPTETHYVIIGNEPNHGEEWGGKPDPTAYARFFADVADALRAADPAIQVLNAALDPYAPHTGNSPHDNGFYYIDAESFMDAMVESLPDVFLRVDVWNSHSYPSQFTAPPWEQRYGVNRLNDAAAITTEAPPPNIYNRGINGYTWELWKLAQYGIEGLPVMITETGWRHEESVIDESLDAGDNLPDGLTVARYFDLALWGNGGRYPDLPEAGWTPLLSDERVMAVIAFALNGNPLEWGYTNWLVMKPDGTVSATYEIYDMVYSWQKALANRE